MILSNIHKILFRNLFIGGAIIAILTGIVVSLIELKRIDKYVEEIAFEESKTLYKYYIQFYNNRTESQLAKLRQAIQDSLNHDLFIFVEFIDENMENITKESIEGFDKIEPELTSKFNNFTMSKKFEHQTIYYKSSLYIKVMVHIYGQHENKIIGHFEGIYHLPDNKMAEIKKRSYYSIGLSMVVVLLTTLFLYSIILKLYNKLLARSYELLQSNMGILKSLGSAIAKRDSDTNSHNYRVTIFSVKLAEKVGLDKSRISSLVKGAFLHDIGKIGISDNILLKQGKLTDDEYETMKQHIVLGTEIVQNTEWLKDAIDVIRYHHEKIDGSGYTSGLKDKDIPLNAKIFAIADVFDALTSKRPYKKPFSLEKSMEIIKEGSGSHFDPELVKNFEEIAETLYAEISHLEDERQLSNYLDLLVNKYFTVETS